MTDLLRLERLVVGYQGKALLPPVDLDIRSNSFLGIVGPNGSGKSTLVRTMLGLEPPVSGRILRHEGRRLRFGYVPQQSEAERMFPLTTRDMVVMGRFSAIGLGRPVRSAEFALAERALDRVGIGEFAARPLATLSGGQRQRALIARALISEPDVLVLDEPTTGMDLIAERALLKLIKSFSESDLAVVLISHQLTLVAEFVKEVLLVDRERHAVEQGPVSEVVTEARLSRLFGTSVVVRNAFGHLVIFPDLRKTPRGNDN